ncbi:NAD-dependent succinate-semialdehyde dehydrogenase [Rhodococcus sp. NCIMB 12038]|uniref:NAD-dependent succinate-semialdehyde dehydrogenase n=1 Tax=Rhodococcus sp. NCIMB 12038 TaxID=933800 RepID=UPI000B3C2AF5|nr:NAD-dependent succinate-semialdehyde dehydrogenase [Rhodococcus sp. NCIMB 12038]OUS92178.1 NAD-dependent succinate-semialdehyde dehydrogenase [Rhodococcus sp. NCIMB 12038]
MTITVEQEQAGIAAVPKELFIGGQWVPATGGATLDVFDPSTGQVLCQVADASAEDAMRALDVAVATQPSFAATTARHRSDILRKTYELMLERTDELALIMTLEAGKPIDEAKAEITLAADFVRHFSEEAVRVTGNYQVNPAGGGRMIVTRQPIGPAILVAPWNFPMSMGARKIAPAIAAGCTCVVKPASETPLTMFALAQLFHEAGVPDGAINVVTTKSPREVIEPLIRSGKARKLSFTGSTSVGVHLLEQAAQKVLKTSMELGGNAPFIVFDDADIENALDSLMLTKMRNAGETCTAANRIYVHRSVMDTFAVKLADRMSGFFLGRGVEEGVTLGPLINEKQQTLVDDLVRDAIQAGAELVLGGKRPDRPGYFFEPTVLRDVPATARVTREEIFGPVAPLIPFDTEEEVIAYANDTDYGLVSYIFTEDLRRAIRVAEAMESGMVGLNQGSVSNSAAPFGGAKMSGLGREGGSEGLDEFLETKFIAMQL